MKIFSTLSILLLSSLLSFPQTAATEREPGQLLVQLKPSSGNTLVNSLLESYGTAGLRIETKLSSRMNIWLLGFDETKSDPVKLLSDIKKHPAVNLAQFNHKVQQREIIPNDPSFSNEWALKNTGQMNGTPGADIKATYAWDITTSGLTINGDTIVVAMVDGGIDLTHTDLHLWKNRLEIPVNNIDDDENGYVDDYNGWNAYTNTGNMQTSDHGTHVAGIATAVGDNNTGIAGVAFNTYLMPIAGSGSNEATVVIAYDYVFEMRKRYNETNGAAGAFIVATNSSFGIDGGNPENYPLWGAIYDSLGSVGILNVASTANRGWDIDLNGDIPTAMTNASIVSVTNTTNTDIQNSISGWGLTTIDLGAPGTNIYSTRQGNTYGYKTGTSMSSPFVTGSIALMYAAADEATMQLYNENPELVSGRFKRYLIASVDTIPTMVGKSVSGGRLNLYNAIQMVVNPPSIICNPEEVSLIIEPNSIDTVTLQLSSLNTETNPYTLVIPGTTPWAYTSEPGGSVIGTTPDSVTLIINTTGLAVGQYSSTLTINDYFLNELSINLNINVEEGVGTRFNNNLQSTLSAGPNPFNTSTTLNFVLEQASNVSLIVYGLSGQKIASLFEGNRPAGAHTLNWNPAIKPGIYMIRMITGDVVRVVKVVKR